MPVIGSSTASNDLGRRSMMAMKDGAGSGSAIPPDAFNALSARVGIVEDRQQASPTRAELRRAVIRASIVGAVAGGVLGCALAVVVGRLIG